MRQSGILSRSMSAESISGLYSCMAKVLIARFNSLRGGMQSSSRRLGEGC